MGYQRDYIHVMDLAGGHILCLEALDRDDIYEVIQSSGGTSGFGGSGGKYKAYNLGKGKGMSVLNMIDAMKKASGFDYKFEIIGRRTGDVPDLTADPAVAEKELGFKANRSLEEMCRDQWNWQSKNPNVSRTLLRCGCQVEEKADEFSYSCYTGIQLDVSVPPSSQSPVDLVPQ